MTRFGPYTVFECVGSGGMATVHRATIPVGEIDREVALKRLLPHLEDEQRFVEDFVREAKLAAHLQHPNIVRIYELGKIGRTYFIAMELVRGASLSSLLKKAALDKRPSLGAVFSLMLELSDALDHAHNTVDAHGAALHLVHRDLTPSNLLVTEDGHLKIIDFGVAKAMSGDLTTNSGAAKGKIGYMSPEAIAVARVDGRTDIFSVGVVMWELLTGRRLFQPAHDWDRSIHDQKLDPPSTFNRECSPAVDKLVMKMIAKDADERFATADELHHALIKVSKPFAGTTNPKAVLRWQRTLRVESNFEPYATFMVEEQSLGARKRSSSRALIEAASSWPVEPTTQPDFRFKVDSNPQMDLLPETMIPSDFDPDLVEQTSDETKQLSIKRGKKSRAPLRPPNPSPSADRIPKRSPLDTEPNLPTIKPIARTTPRPVDTEPIPRPTPRPADTPPTPRPTPRRPLDTPPTPRPTPRPPLDTPPTPRPTPRPPPTPRPTPRPLDTEPMPRPTFERAPTSTGSKRRKR